MTPTLKVACSTHGRQYKASKGGSDPQRVQAHRRCMKTADLAASAIGDGALGFKKGWPPADLEKRAFLIKWSLQQQ